MPGKIMPRADQPAQPAANVIVEWYDGGESKRSAGGLTIREHMATQFMAALLGGHAITSFDEQVVPLLYLNEVANYVWSSDRTLPSLAPLAVQAADALLAELAKKTG